MDGVIAAIQVDPNQTVDAGTVLLHFDDTKLRNDYELAKKTLAVAVAEYQRSAQAAFADKRDNAEVALLRAKAELAAAERDYAQEMLSRVEVKAVHGGVVQFRDKADWIGKPVQTGERIVEIADPSQVRLRVSLPVKDAIALSEGAEVRAFFDIDPLHPLTARVKRVAHRAELLPGDILAYRIDADLQTSDKAEQAIRIGARGTAKLYGARLPLAYHLFRRPLSAARQYFGL